MGNNNINLNDLANGAVGERFNMEWSKVLQNIKDPNTSAKAKRKVTLTLTLEPDEEREIAIVGIETKATIAPPKGIATKIIMDMDRSGQVVGAELKSGSKNQMMVDDEGDVADDRGNKVSYLERKNQAQGGK